MDDKYADPCPKSFLKVYQICQRTLESWPRLPKRSGGAAQFIHINFDDNRVPPGYLEWFTESPKSLLKVELVSEVNLGG